MNTSMTTGWWTAECVNPIADGPDVPLEGFDETFFGSPDQNLTTFEAHIVRGRIDHRFSEALRGNVTVQYADYDKLYQNLFAAGFRPDPRAPAISSRLTAIATRRRART